MLCSTNEASVIYVQCKSIVKKQENNNRTFYLLAKFFYLHIYMRSVCVLRMNHKGMWDV